MRCPNCDRPISECQPDPCSTRYWAAEFRRGAADLRRAGPAEGVDPELHALSIAACESMAEELEAECSTRS